MDTSLENSCLSHENSRVTKKKKIGRGLSGQPIHRATKSLKTDFPEVEEASQVSKTTHEDRPALITIGLLKNPSHVNALLYF